MTLVLGIESSCDETAAAVVEDGVRVRSNALHSQIDLHERFRGVVPEIASRSHTTRILPIVDAALEDAGVTPDELDAIAVTSRPGMIGCLLVGLAAAKTLSWLFDKPLVGVDHVQAHLHAAFMTDPDLPTPSVALVASGGHTALYQIDAPGDTRLLGRTIDDAAGEALDKGAALLGLPYPGGPSIEKAALDGNPKTVRLPRSTLSRDSLDFSFSGVKTALLYHLRGNGLERPMPDLDAGEVADLAASYQQAVIEALVKKLRRAAERIGARSLAIGGGVARNTLLRELITADPVLGALHRVFPPMDLCTDNGAMIAGLGTHLWHAEGPVDLTLDAVATARNRR